MRVIRSIIVILPVVLSTMVVSALDLVRLASDMVAEEDNGIVFGEEVERNRRFPYMTIIFDGEDNWRCGGSLIAPTWVLTAAHCADDNQVARVEVGRYHLDRRNDHFEKINVNKTIVHPRWTDGTLSFDFALLELEQPSTKQIIALDDGSEELFGLPFFGTQLTIVGFGSTFGYGFLFYPTVLQEAAFTYYENWMCNLMVFPYIFTFQDNEICTNNIIGGACSGDSGGPLFVKGHGVAEDVLVGVVSFGYRPCGQTTRPDGFGRVSFVYDWIQSSIA